MGADALVPRITAAVRVADERFESSGGSSRHFVRECLLPALDEAMLSVVDKRESEMTEQHRGSAERDVRSLANKLDDAERLVADLIAALLAVSPWKLQDCWCVEDDCGGAKKHSNRCLLARAAIAKARGT